MSNGEAKREGWRMKMSKWNINRPARRHFSTRCAEEARGKNEWIDLTEEKYEFSSLHNERERQKYEKKLELGPSGARAEKREEGCGKNGAEKLYFSPDVFFSFPFSAVVCAYLSWQISRVEKRRRVTVALDINDSKDEKFGKVQTINIIISEGGEGQTDEQSEVFISLFFPATKEARRRRINVNKKCVGRVKRNLFCSQLLAVVSKGEKAQDMESLIKMKGKISSSVLFALEKNSFFWVRKYERERGAQKIDDKSLFYAIEISPVASFLRSLYVLLWQNLCHSLFSVCLLFGGFRASLKGDLMRKMMTGGREKWMQFFSATFN